MAYYSLEGHPIHSIEPNNSISDADCAAAYSDGVISAPSEDSIITRPLNGHSPNFAAIVSHIKNQYRIRVRRWRKHMSGCAWSVSYSDGRIINWIEAPRPRTAISLAIFLHEVGHHVIGFNRYRVRCEEEYHVWLWALNQMRKLGVEPDARVQQRFDRSMEYAVRKALRRGAKRLPDSLLRFAPEAV